MHSAAGLIVSLAALAGCSGLLDTREPTGSDGNLVAAEAFVDAFYSFDSAKLKNILAAAEGSIPEIAFYQGWAQGGHYRIVRRSPCRAESATTVSCSITVKDDLIGALGIDFDVTDTFHLSLPAGRITAVTTSSDDPEVFHEAKEWVKRNRADLIREPCRGYFDGGPTPGKCVEAMVRGFAEFAASDEFPRSH